MISGIVTSSAAKSLAVKLIAKTDSARKQRQLTQLPTQNKITFNWKNPHTQTYFAVNDVSEFDSLLLLDSCVQFLGSSTTISPLVPYSARLSA